jgi:Ca2+-transporting ATPase
MTEEKENLHSLPLEQVIQAFGSDQLQGLSAQEAAGRLRSCGPNELQERPRPRFWQMLLAQFDSFVIWILIAASIVSALLGDYVEAAAILAIVIVNAIIGVVQDGKAEKALAALKELAAPDAHVIRDGRRMRVPARELVPGDVVSLEAGNFVPADVRLLTSANLQVDEASLTGESHAIQKDTLVGVARDAVLGDRRNMAYMGTLVTYGRGRGVVVATAMETEVGHIAELIQSYEEEATPLQARLDQLGRWLGCGCLAICALVYVFAVARDTNWTVIAQEGALNYVKAERTTLVGLFMVAISLAIAAVPEGLPAIVTINLAIGMREMIKHHVLIRRLQAVETLGSASVICSDKTGTLTQNEMTAVQLSVWGAQLRVTGEGYQPIGDFIDLDRDEAVNLADYADVGTLLRGALLCSDAALEKVDGETSGRGLRIVGDPTEGALLVAAAKANMWRDKCEMRYPRMAEVPFDSTRKRMSTVHKDVDGKGYVVFVKGAPDFVLELCARALRQGDEVVIDDKLRQRITQANQGMAKAALRNLAVAYREIDVLPGEVTPETIERDLVFVGLVGMIDPARPEIAPAMNTARNAGIRTVMVTGDYPDTARAVAEQVGLLRPWGRVLSGADLNQMSDEQLMVAVDEVDVFARVSPEHKVRIVEAFKARGQVVAMTGDGVNDAPALKRANIGVAMGITGTDVSKETADMVLTDDNYASIVSAVEQGRSIYANIRKFVYYLLSCNLAEIGTIFFATLLGWPSPLTPIQLLWLNLLTDGPPALALGAEKGEPGIMDRPPRPVDEPIINREMRLGMIIQTVAITAVVLSAYWLGLKEGQALYGMDSDTAVTLARTMAFITLAASELFRAYTARSEYHSLFRIGMFSNRYMQIAVALSVLLLLAVIYVPALSPIFDTTPVRLQDWAKMLPLFLVPALAAELTKWVMRNRWMKPDAEASRCEAHHSRVQRHHSDIGRRRRYGSDRTERWVSISCPDPWPRTLLLVGIV